MASTKRNAGSRARGNSNAGGGGAGSSGPSRGGTSSSHDREVGGGGGGGGTVGSSSLSSGSTRPRGLSDVRGNMNYGSPNDATGFGGGLNAGGLSGYGSVPDGRNTVMSSSQRNR